MKLTMRESPSLFLRLVMTNLKKSEGLDRIVGFIETKGGLKRAG